MLDRRADPDVGTDVGTITDHGSVETGPLLEVRDLTVTFHSRQGSVRAVDGLSFSVGREEILGVVGESGSGKSVSMMSILKLIRDPNAEISGQAFFNGQDLTQLSDKQLRSVRGRQIAMVFQDPMTALTPVYTVGWHIVEQLQAHQNMSRSQAKRRAVELLKEVGIPAAERRVDDFPHQFSGGMRQRVVIAMALANDPSLLIADEPTTALDVTTQAQVLDLMMRLRQNYGSSIIIITHDMGVVSQVADRVLVMYGGRAAEIGTREEVFRTPDHPYTWGLLGSVPRVSGQRVARLTAIPGSPISASEVPSGCAFAPRCPHRFDACAQRPPLEAAAGEGQHLSSCWLPFSDRARLRKSGAMTVATTKEPT